MSTFLSDLGRHGFVFVKSFLPTDQALEIRQSLKNNVVGYAEKMNVSPDVYLSAVSRWDETSSLLLDLSFRDVIHRKMESLIDLKLISKKYAVTYKNKATTSHVPFHQDISYYPQNPYALITWVSLHDSPSSAGAVEVIPETHHLLPQEGADLWSPFFRDMYASPRFSKLKFPFQPGDALVFDSRLLHGIAPFSAPIEKWALVSRWSYAGFKVPPIPAYHPKPFGLWTARRDLLIALHRYWRNPRVCENITSFNEWIAVVQDKKYTDPGINLPLAIDALKRVHTLDIASRLHQAGDAFGTVYKNAWRQLVYPFEKGLHDLVK